MQIRATICSDDEITGARVFIPEGERGRALLIFHDRHQVSRISLHGVPRPVAEDTAEAFNHGLAEHALAEAKAHAAAENNPS